LELLQILKYSVWSREKKIILSRADRKEKKEKFSLLSLVYFISQNASQTWSELSYQLSCCRVSYFLCYLQLLLILCVFSWSFPTFALFFLNLQQIFKKEYFYFLKGLLIAINKIFTSFMYIFLRLLSKMLSIFLLLS